MCSRIRSQIRRAMFGAASSRQGAKLGQSLKSIIRMTPVSYTHLAVKPRLYQAHAEGKQLEETEAAFHMAFQMKKNFVKRATQADYIRQMLDAGEGPVILCGDFNDTPVSYTHLPVHLLKAVIMTGESVTNFIFQKLGVNAQNLNMVLDRQIESYPKVSGGEPYLSSESNAVLQKAIDYSSKMGDQYVSLEPIILALFTEKSTASQILKDAGVTEKELRQAIEELRKGKKVTSQSAEETYDALGRCV